MPTGKICETHCPDEGAGLGGVLLVATLFVLAVLGLLVWFVMGHLVLVLIATGSVLLLTGVSQRALLRWGTVQLPTRERLAELTARLAEQGSVEPEPEPGTAEWVDDLQPTGWQPQVIVPPTRLRVVRDDEAG
jgi:hypothetical protein